MTENENPAEPPEAPATPAPAPTSKSARLTAAEEDEALHLAKELLLAGRASIPAAVEALVTFPWNVGVAAVTATWPELKPASRKQLLSSFEEQKSDAGKRLRLSIARGLLPVDTEALEKMATDICTDMRTEGAMSSKDRHAFANVFIGKGKPWLQNISIASWADPQPLIACAIEVCFAAPCAPFTQVGLLRWLGAAGRLADLDEPTLALMAKAVKRWSGRFQSELKNEMPELPAALAEVIQTPPEARPAEPAETAAVTENESAEPDGSTDSALERMVASTRGERRSSAPRVSRRENAAEQNFDPIQALRQIESHLTSLRKDLQDAKAALRHRESPRGRSSRREQAAPADGLPPDAESLQRHNAQLEETVAELRQRLEDLASDHEDRAAATQTHESDNRAQLLELLGLKLNQNFAEFQALRSNAADEVVRQHFADMLDSIFKVLQEEGVRFH